MNRSRCRLGQTYREQCIRWDAHRRYLTNTMDRSVRQRQCVLSLPSLHHIETCYYCYRNVWYCIVSVSVLFVRGLSQKFLATQDKFGYKLNLLPDIIYLLIDINNVLIKSTWSIEKQASRKAASGVLPLYDNALCPHLWCCDVCCNWM